MGKSATAHQNTKQYCWNQDFFHFEFLSLHAEVDFYVVRLF